MLISYYANKKSSPRLPSWQPSLISFNTPIDSGSIIKPCTLKHFQVPILAPGLLQEERRNIYIWGGGGGGGGGGVGEAYMRSLMVLPISLWPIRRQTIIYTNAAL